MAETNKKELKLLKKTSKTLKNMIKMSKNILNILELVLLFAKNYLKSIRGVQLELKMSFLLIINSRQSQPLTIKKYWKYLRMQMLT
jgi:hypothetical protein